MHGRAEMRKIDLSKRPLVDVDVDFKPSVLDVVGRIVFDVGNCVLLDALHEGHPHARKMMDVLAVRLLRPAPARMI